MLRKLDSGEQFAGFIIRELIQKSFVVDTYRAKDSQGQDCVLRIFNQWKIFDPKTQDCGDGQEYGTINSSSGVEVYKENGDKFEYFQNRLSITQELSGLPGFPQIVATGAYNGCLYFGTKWIEGQDLKFRIQHSEIKPDEKLKIMHLLALPLEQMHSRNLLHNDVKSRNYIVGDNGEVILIDFDLSLYGERRIFDGKSMLWHELENSDHGTADYIAPEITPLGVGVGFTEFSDVWSGLGVVPYRLLTKHMPFFRYTDSGLYWAIRQESPARVETRLPEDFPQRKRVSDLVHWCLEKDWKKRPRATQFRKELEGILTEEGIDWN